MANEVTANFRLTLSSGVIALDFKPGALYQDYTPLVVYNQRVSIATAETTVTHGVANPRYCVLYNHDATNYVEAGTTAVATADYPIRLRPSSMPSIFEINSTETAILLRANTAACYVQIIVF